MLKLMLLNFLNIVLTTNAKNQVGNSVLSIVASNNNLAIIKLLIKSGGNVNAVNDLNWPVIHSAVFGIIKAKGKWEVYRALT